MGNTSATGGVLTPSSSAPLSDAALTDFFQAIIVGLTSIPAANVRPRWQAEPADIPLDGIDWVALGITKRVPDSYAYEVHKSGSPSYNEIRRHEILHLLISFYGPDADGNASLFGDGLQVAQNREVFTLNNMGFVDCGEAVVFPELVKGKWYNRVDVPMRVRRQVVRDYAVLDLVSASATLNNEHYTTTITAPPQ